VPKPIHKALPWATAAGATVFAAAMIASQVGAGAAVANPMAAPVVNPVGTSPVAHSAMAKSTSGVAVTKTAKATKAAKAAKPGTPAAKSEFKFMDSSYIENLRASAVQVEADIPHPLVPGVGYSAVNLEKDPGVETGICEIYGAGAYFTDVVQEGVLENSGPPDAGNKGGGIFNPTESKDTAPNLSPGENLNSRHPSIRDLGDGHQITAIPAEGNGLDYQAHCDSDVGGKGIGYNTDLAGYEQIGSVTQTAVNKETGEYTGVSRAFVLGVETPNGTLDGLASLVKIKALPDKDPVFDYTIGTIGGSLVAGTGVKESDLTKSFNDSAQGIGPALDALGEYGIELEGPYKTESENGHRPIVNFPYFNITTGLKAREGTIGQSQHVRLVNIDYEGAYTGSSKDDGGAAPETPAAAPSTPVVTK
jgi:hypothetical protein